MNKSLNKRFQILLVIFSLMPFAAWADAASTKREINGLARDIQDALIGTTAGESQLLKAKAQLQSALNLLQQSGGGGAVSDDCLNFAYSKYNQALSSAEALNKAGQACRLMDSLEVMQFLYGKFYQGLTTVDAMDEAAESSRAPMAGKMDIVQFSYQKYNQALTSVEAARKAGDGARQVSANSSSCVRNAFSKYNQSLPTAEAMDAAFALCQTSKMLIRPTLGK